MANMGVPEKKISPYFYAFTAGCVIAMPIVMFLGYLLDLIHKAKVVESKEEEKSELDLIFDQRKEADPKALSVQYYDEFKQAAGKTMQSILISTTTKLQYFKLPDVRNLTCTDNIHLEEVGDEYTALFIIIPPSDTTYNCEGSATVPMKP
ncbi:MAG: type IV secretory system conjugative DNA transfer family protein [Huintestinicola sp.]